MTATAKDTFGDNLGLERWSANRGIDSINNYVGPDLSDQFEGPGQGRDSDLLTQSNFASALESLGGESETVEVVRFGHWACGWFELILVHESDHKALKVLAEIAEALAYYPILDDEDYRERESDYIAETFEYYRDDFKSELEKLVGPKFIATIKDLIALDQLLSHLYTDDCYYRGAEDGYLTADAIQRSVRNVYLPPRSKLYALNRRICSFLDRNCA